jgi:hypothetical protein
LIGDPRHFCNRLQQWITERSRRGVRRQARAPLHGSNSELADKALAGETYTEPHYQRRAQRVLGVEYLGLGSTAGPPAFARVRVGPTTLDLVDAETFAPEHYAIQITDEELDTILTRIKDAGLSFYADPRHEQEGELNDWNGGHGFYFSDPHEGHNIELLTHPG